MKPLTQALLVGAGGFVGSILRYALSGLVHRVYPFASFPFGTLAVNVVGCLAIGLAAGLAETRQVMGSGLRLFLWIGLFGGFTTFSTFGYETFALVREGATVKAGANVILQVAVGLTAVWLGHALSRLG